MTAVVSLTQVQVMVDQRPYTTHPIAKINKVKYNVTNLISVFSLSSLHLLLKTHLKQSFCYTFIHS